MKTFGELIREARHAKQYSMSALAQITQTFKGYICGIETGKLNPPSPKMVRRLSRALDLDVNDMLVRSVFEKLPKGLRFHKLRELLDEAERSGISEAKDLAIR